MRCGICPVTFCQYRRTDGDCYVSWDKGYEPADSTKEQYLNDEQVKMMEAIVFLTTHGWTCITPDGIDVVALKTAAQDLVDAVERYVEPKPGQEFVHRSEILLKKNALKELINGR